MTTYEQIKDLVLEFMCSDIDGPVHIVFDEWASNHGKELMDTFMSTDSDDQIEKIRQQIEATEKLREGQSQQKKDAAAIAAYGNIAKIITGINPLVYPSSTPEQEAGKPYEERLQMYAQMHEKEAEMETGNYACPYSGDKLAMQAEVTRVAAVKAIKEYVFSTLPLDDFLIEKGYVPKP